jgi:hypothetical protein
MGINPKAVPFIDEEKISFTFVVKMFKKKKMFDVTPSGMLGNAALW